MFYAHLTHPDQESSPDVVTCMLQIIQFDVHEFLDVGDTLYFLTYNVAVKFDVCLKLLLKLFSGSTLVDDFIILKRVYQKFPSLYFLENHRVDLVELDMISYDVYLNINLIHAC